MEMAAEGELLHALTDCSMAALLWRKLILKPEDRPNPGLVGAGGLALDE